MHITTSRRTLALGLLLATAAGASRAQFGGGGGGGMRRGRGEEGGSTPRRRDADGAAAGPSRREHLANALLDTRLRLLVTPAQAPLWDAFQAAFNRASGLTATAATAALGATPTGALGAMQQQLSAAQNRYALAESLADTLKPLVAAFDDQQKRTADEVLPGLLAEGLGGPGATIAAHAADTAGTPIHR